MWGFSAGEGPSHARTHVLTHTRGHTHTLPRHPLPPAGFPDLSQNRVASKKRIRKASGQLAGRTGVIEKRQGGNEKGVEQPLSWAREGVRIRCWEGSGDAGGREIRKGLWRRLADRWA